MKTSNIRLFNFLRAFVIVAIVCTMILTTFILLESGMEASLTTAITNMIKNDIQETFDVKDYDVNLAPKRISAYCTSIYYNKPKKLTVTTEPANANPAYIAEFVNVYGRPVEGISIDEEGYITSTRLTLVDGGIFLKLTSKLDPNVTTKYALNVFTLDPRDHRIERVEYVLSNKWLNLEPTTDEYVKVGRVYYQNFAATIKEEYLEELGLTQENNKVLLGTASGAMISTRLDGEKLANGNYQHTDDYYVGASVCFFKPCSLNLSFIIRSSIGDPLIFDVNLEGVVDPDFDYVPEYIKLSQTKYENKNLKYVNGEYVLTFLPTASSFNVMALGQNPYRNVFVSLDYFDEHSKECVRLVNGSVYRKVNRGECYIWAKSTVAPEDESLWIKVRVVFEGEEPNKLSISTTNITHLNGYIMLNHVINNGGNFFDEGEVRWTILEGEDKVKWYTSDQLVANKLGTVRLRVESVKNPELYDEISVEIKLYDTTYYFVRKILGHAGLYALLGIGHGVIYFFLIKPRWITSIATPATIFAIGGIGELLQSLHPGRYPAWADVAIDFIGGLVGLAVAALLLTAICLIWRKINRKSFDSLTESFKAMNLITFFKKAEKAFAYKYASKVIETGDEADAAVCHETLGDAQDYLAEDGVCESANIVENGVQTSKINAEVPIEATEEVAVDILTAENSGENL